MSTERRVSLTKAAEPVPALPIKRRLVVALMACLATAVLTGAAIVWEPWVDRSPFTARSYGAVASARFTNSGDGTCVPEDAGKTAQLLGEDRQRLAESRFQVTGEVLTSGAAAGSCLFYVEFENVPRGEDAYYVKGGTKNYTEDGKVFDPALSEEDLDHSLAEIRKQFTNLPPTKD